MWLSLWLEILVVGLGCNIERTNQGNGWVVHWFSENAKTALIFCLRERRGRRRLLHQNDRTDVPQGWTLDSQLDHISLCLCVCLSDCLCLCGWTIVKVTSNWRHQRRSWREIVHRSLWYKPAIMGACGHGQEGALAPLPTLVM